MPAADGAQRWLHADTGVVAVASVEGSTCCLGLLGADGTRCSAPLVFLALAEFDLLGATEDRSVPGPQRLFRLSGRSAGGRPGA